MMITAPYGMDTTITTLPSILSANGYETHLVRASPCCVRALCRFPLAS
jgi:arylsulfatase A-like enzyme